MPWLNYCVTFFKFFYLAQEAISAMPTVEFVEDKERKDGSLDFVSPYEENVPSLEHGEGLFAALDQFLLSLSLSHTVTKAKQKITQDNLVRLAAAACDDSILNMKKTVRVLGAYSAS
jgi:hypothetical protein